MDLSLNHLLDYTDWQRKNWHDSLRNCGEQVLSISAGPNGDGRFEVIGDLIRHIFSAEKRYVERLTGRPLTDIASVPNDSIEALFEFGHQSRKELKQLLETFPAAQWDISREFKILNFVVNATPRKVVTHIVMHDANSNFQFSWRQFSTLSVCFARRSVQEFFSLR
jgi:uncharacterized damage-inducible protein DinB